MFGTLQLLDTLAAARNTLVADLGEDTTFNQIQIALGIHNRITNELVGTLAERSTDKMRAYGGTDSMVMQKLDEFGQPSTQKVAAGATLGFPLDFYGAAVQWTRHYFAQSTVEEFTRQFDALRTADIQRVKNEIIRALLTPTNYSFLDHLDRQQLTLPVKALINADSATIPLGPNGETFNGATHTHYLARVAALAASDISGLVNTVLEHHPVGQTRIYINRADQAALEAFTSNYMAYQPVTVRNLTAGIQAIGDLDTLNPNDREIGLWDKFAVVSVKPWVPANYMFAFQDGAPPPLVMRTPERGPDSGDLGLLYDNEQFPLRARAFGRKFGFGSWTRTNGAVLYIGGTSYVAPTIS